jgi:hypothetical protein
MCQAQQGPQAALDGGLDQLLQIGKVALKQLSGNANGDVGVELGGSISSVHPSPRRTVVEFDCAYFLSMRGKDFLAKREVKEV